MDSEFRKRIQIILLVGVALAGLRVPYIVYQRHQDSAPPSKPVSYPQQADDFVRPPKIYPYDLKSAGSELIGKTVWVRAGNVLPYYRYDSASRSADLTHKVGVLASLEKLEIKDVIQQKAPVPPGRGEVVVVHKEILAVFEKAGTAGKYAFSVGTNPGDNYAFTANDTLYFADPHDLYKHWPADVWA